MSNEFNALRARARQKRDAALAEIQADYQAALVQIARLEQDLLGKVRSRYRKISAAIEAVIPKDGTFTTADILVSLEALDSRRYWRKRFIDNHISRLRERGLIKRIKRATIHEPAVYVRAGSTAKVVPLGDMTLLEAIGSVLTEPLTTTEIVVAVLEAGCHTTMNRTHLRQHVRREMGKHFKQDGGRWLP
jgi:hypothetical protein